MGRRQGRFNKKLDLRKGYRIVRWVGILHINFSEACGFHFTLLTIHSSEYDCHLFYSSLLFSFLSSHPFGEEKEIDRSTD